MGFAAAAAALRLGGGAAAAAAAGGGLSTALPAALAGRAAPSALGRAMPDPLCVRFRCRVGIAYPHALASTLGLTRKSGSLSLSLEVLLMSLFSLSNACSLLDLASLTDPLPLCERREPVAGCLLDGTAGASAAASTQTHIDNKYRACFALEVLACIHCCYAVGIKSRICCCLRLLSAVSCLHVGTHTRVCPPYPKEGLPT